MSKVGASALAACAALAVSFFLAADAHQESANAPLVSVAAPNNGAFKTRVFVVYDEDKNAVVRKAYSVWDPAPERDLDFDWLPDQPASSETELALGSGKLVWRERGKASYDTRSVVSVYTGTLKDGRPEGYGELRTRDGLNYDGSWHRGQFDGHGELLFPDSARYVGAFKDGKFDGAGTLVGADNVVFTGDFRNGLKQGRGHTEFPSGARYESVWAGGVEDLESRQVRLAQAGTPADAAAQLKPEDLRVTFQVERPPEPRILAYIARNEVKHLSILPDDKHLLKLWKQSGPISDPFLAWDYRSIPINVRVRNQSDKPLTIKAAMVEIDESEADLKPVFELVYDPNEGIGEDSELLCGGENHFAHDFDLVNHGWSDPVSLKLEFAFSSAPGKPATPLITAPITPPFEKAGVTYDLSANLTAFGVNTGKLSEWSAALNLDKKGLPFHEEIDEMLQCRGLDDAACLSKIKASGVLGRLAPFVSIKDGLIITHMSGRVIFTWVDAKKASHEEASPIALRVLLGSRKWACGSEAGDQNPDQDPDGVTVVDFKFDGAAYNVKVPFKRTLAPGKDGRFKLLLRARKSATHKMRLVFETDDGRRLTSKDVELQAFVSSRYPQSKLWQ